MMKHLSKTASLVALILGFWFVCSSANAMAGEKCSGLALQQAVTDEGTGSGITGNATLCADDHGVRAEMELENLTPGVAYTVWFVYFDDPSQCRKPQECGPPDVSMGDDPVGVLGRIYGFVADESGKREFAADLPDFRISSESHIHLSLFGHGMANDSDGRFRARQLLTPQAPGLGAPGLGAPADGRVGQLKAAAIIRMP